MRLTDSLDRWKTRRYTKSLMKRAPELGSLWVKGDEVYEVTGVEEEVLGPRENFRIVWLVATLYSPKFTGVSRIRMDYFVAGVATGTYRRMHL